MGDISYISRSHLVFLQGKVNGALYIAGVVKLMILPFLRQKCDVCLHQDNVHPHTAAAMQRDLHGVQQLPWPARSPDLSPIEHIWEKMKRELPEHATTIAELRQRVQDAWDNLTQDDIRHFHDCLYERIHACITAREKYTLYLFDCLGTPYCEIVIIYSYNDKLPVKSIFNTMNLSLKVIKFFPVMDIIIKRG